MFSLIVSKIKKMKTAVFALVLGLASAIGLAVNSASAQVAGDFANEATEEMASTSGAFITGFIAHNWPFMLGLIGLVILGGMIKWAVGSIFRP